MQTYSTKPGLNPNSDSKITWVLLWIVLFALALCFQWTDFLHKNKARAWPYLKSSESNFYYAWGRSLLFDYDADFRNDLQFLARHCVGGDTPAFFSHYLQTRNSTALGLISNRYPVGPGLLALPALTAVKEFGRIKKHLGFSSFSPIFPLTFIFNQILVGFLGVLLSYLVLKGDYKEKAVGPALLIGTISSALGYYLIFDPTTAHLPGLACCALMIFCLQKSLNTLRRSTKSSPTTRAGLFWAALAGIVFGLGCCMSYPNFVFVCALPIFLSSKQQRLNSVWQNLCLLIVFAAGTLLGTAPQLVVWKALYGTWFMPGLGEQVLSLWPLNIGQLLFGLKSGLFVWAPIMLLAIIGLIRGSWRGSPLARSGLLIFLATSWAYGTMNPNSLGSGFGAQSFIDMSLFFFVGLAECLEFLYSKMKPLMANLIAVPIAGLALIFGIALILSYRAAGQRAELPINLQQTAKLQPFLAQIDSDLNLWRRFREPHFLLWYPEGLESEFTENPKDCSVRAKSHDS